MIEKIPEEYNEVVGDYTLKNNLYNYMGNGIGDFNLVNIKSAFVYMLLTASLEVLSYVIALGDIFKIDFHVLINLFVVALAVGLVSFIKSLLTTHKGNFLGVIKVVE